MLWSRPAPFACMAASVIAVLYPRSTPVSSMTSGRSAPTVMPSTRRSTSREDHSVRHSVRCSGVGVGNQRLSLSSR
jgi:hypothetical protein